MRRWEVLADLMKEFGLLHMVEVGCKEGRTTEWILENVPDSTVYAIDPMRPVANSAEDYADWDYEAIEQEFRSRTEKYGDRVVLDKRTSFRVAAELEAEFDLVFIDAAHDFESVAQDIDVWYSHLKDGGLMCGHDFQHKFPGVERAVAHHFNLMHVQICNDSVWVVRK